MIINGRIITGIFKYNPNSTFTQGDLVLKGTTIYIARTESTNVDPSTDKSGKFEIYPGFSQYTSVDDYLNYESTGNPASDKYITVGVLPLILNHYLTGVNEKGLIEDTEYNSSEMDGDISRSSADEILMSDMINHAIFAVTRQFEGLPTNVYSREYILGRTDKLILKQYTYNQKVFVSTTQEIHRIRVQELIDHTQYMVWYRSVDLESKGRVPSEWKPININIEHVYDRINDLVKDYRDRINALQQVINDLRRNFKYKCLDNVAKSNIYNIPLNYIGNSRLTLEIVWRDSDSTAFYRKTEITIDLRSDITKYVSDGVYISVDEHTIRLYSDPEMTTPHELAVFENVYLHEFYG